MGCESHPVGVIHGTLTSRHTYHLTAQGISLLV